MIKKPKHTHTQNMIWQPQVLWRSAVIEFVVRQLFIASKTYLFKPWDFSGRSVQLEGRSDDRRGRGSPEGGAGFFFFILKISLCIASKVDRLQLLFFWSCQWVARKWCQWDARKIYGGLRRLKGCEKRESRSLCSPIFCLTALIRSLKEKRSRLRQTICVKGAASRHLFDGLGSFGDRPRGQWLGLQIML